jgi:5-methylcytosine-specific restriction endonuclease McrA
MSELDPDAFMAMMEERWLALFKEFSRRRAEVAVGLRFDVFKRDGFRCRYCGQSADDGVILHADHVIPQSKGGPTTLDNLVTACFACNLGKSDKDLGDIRPAV